MDPGVAATVRPTSNAEGSTIVGTRGAGYIPDQV
jgi:hypothetical protein